MTDRARDQLAGITTLVTGASGIVGGWLVRALLDRGATVVALLRDETPNADLMRSGRINHVIRVRGDLNDARLVERTLADYEIRLVFHLGAQTQVVTAHRDPLSTMETNVRGTYLLLEAARRQTEPPIVVVGSSDKAYGASTDLPYRETHPLAGRGIYDASKSAADLIASAYAESYGLNVSIARCGNIYGGGDLNWDRIVPGTIRALLQDARPVLRSDGTPRRDYLYVEDAVAAYLRLAERALGGGGGGEAFNFGHNAPVSVLEIVNELRALLGRADLEPVVLGTARHEIPDQYLDSTKARTLLGWVPAHDLHAGLAKTVDWYRELLD